MTDSDLATLRTWASALAPAGCLRSKQVLALLDRDALRCAELADTDAALAEAQARLAEQKAINVALADRVAAQSELLARRACHPTPDA